MLITNFDNINGDNHIVKTFHDENSNNYETGAETTISKQYSKIKTTIIMDITVIIQINCNNNNCEIW